MNDDTMRVVIADDQPHACSAIRLLLAQEPGITVVGEAAGVEEALALVAAQRPDLVLLDWELAGQEGAWVLDRLRAARPGLAVIALSGLPDARQAALNAGADGFVSKSDPPEQLLAAIKACRYRLVT
jgi:DNA-binding NarL/FixJ family response regulator